MYGLSIAKSLWEKLEELYQIENISNRLYLNEQFHTLHIEEGTKISDHLSTLNEIVSKLEAIGVAIEDEDKTLQLIWSLSVTYEHMKPILMYEKETVVFSEVTSKLLFEERRLGGEKKSSLQKSALVVEGWKKKKNSIKRVCWTCGQSGHVKKNYPKSGAGPANSSKSEVNSVEDNTEFL